jgi:hypothetical protein
MTGPLTGLVGAPQYLDTDSLDLPDRVLAYLESPWVTDHMIELGEGLVVRGLAHIDPLYPWIVDVGSPTSGSLYRVNVRDWECACKGRQFHSACKHLVAGGLKVLGE